MSRKEKAKQIGENIKTRRDGVGMSQARLAALSFSKEDDIEKYEAGKKDVPASVLYWIARALSISADKLLGID